MLTREDDGRRPGGSKVKPSFLFLSESDSPNRGTLSSGTGEIVYVPVVGDDWACT
jgi:hypothetical protein